MPAVATLATSAPASPAPTTSAGTGKATSKARAAKTRRDSLARRLEKVSHAQWVSKDGKTGAFVTHDAVRGIVSSVSPTGITIRATDGTSETYTVNSATKVHVKAKRRAPAAPSRRSRS